MMNPDNTESTSTLPVIDIAGLPSPQVVRRVADQLSSAMATSGFFYVTGHSVSSELINNIRQLQRILFNAPASELENIAINSFNRGYLREGAARMHGASTHDQKEVFFWGPELAEDHPDRINAVPLCGPNQWPDAIPGFREIILAYAEGIRTTGNHLLQAIALALGADKHFFAAYYQDSMLRGQLIRYPPTQGDQHHFGVAPHSDFGCITLLLQETPGLEVLVGDNWIPALPVDNALVVNIGDLLERWSDRRLPSTQHRVRNRDTTDRYSIAMFHDPAATAIVNPVDLNPELDSSKYAPVQAAEYISGRNRGAFSHYGEVAPRS